MLFIFNPLEQFEIINFIFLPIGTVVDFSITNFFFTLILISIALLYLLWQPSGHLTLIPGCWQLMLEDVVSFSSLLVRLQVSASVTSFRFFPLIFNLFLLVLLSNFVGLVPFSFTLTSHIFVTATLAISMLIGITIIGGFYNKFNFIKFFVPSGVSGVLLPFLICIEIVSYIIRPFSLSIRLFANMLAGHTLLYILGGFAMVIYVSYTSFFIIPVIFLLLIFVLEFGIAFIQAYVFTILVCIYLNDVHNVTASH